jgi:hypothetical protein
METPKLPVVALEKIHLLSCTVGEVRANAELRFQVGIMALNRKFSDDLKTMDLEVSFDLLTGIENPPCQFVCTFGATYQQKATPCLPWEGFKDHVAVAHLVPFVREFVWNVTSRLPIKGLMIPPTNTTQMLAAYAERTASKVVEDPAALPA